MLGTLGTAGRLEASGLSGKLEALETLEVLGVSEALGTSGTPEATLNDLPDQFSPSVAEETGRQSNLQPLISLPERHVVNPSQSVEPTVCSLPAGLRFGRDSKTRPTVAWRFRLCA